jgi:hypothetical protein
MEGTTLTEALYLAANPDDHSAFSFCSILWVKSSKPQLERDTESQQGEERDSQRRKP